MQEMHSLQIIGPRAVKRLSNSTSNARGNMLTRKSKLLLSLTVATPMLFAACVDNTLIGPYRDVAGTYDLTVFSGASLPVTYTYLSGQNSVVPNGGTITWTDGTMVLTSQGTFTERNNYDYQDNLGASGRQAFTSQGTFTLNGSDFTLSAPPQNNIAARFAQGSLVVSNNSSRINYVEDNGNGTTSAYEYIM